MTSTTGAVPLPTSGGKTSLAVEDQVFRGYRRICFWLGHYYALLSLFRWLLIDGALPWRMPVVASLVVMVLMYGMGLGMDRLAKGLGGLENAGLLALGVLLGNSLLMVAWAPAEKQLFTFLLILVGTSVAFRSPGRFIAAQALCLGTAGLAMSRWVGPHALRDNAFEMLSFLMVSILIWVYLNRLVVALAALRGKDRVILSQKRRLIAELRTALGKVRTLRGLVPICAHCKRVRDDQGFWQQVEAFVNAQTGAEFSHSICPSCMVDVGAEFRRTGPAGRVR